MSFCHFLGGLEGKNRRSLLPKAFMMKKEEERERPACSGGTRNNFTWSCYAEIVTGNSPVSLSAY